MVFMQFHGFFLKVVKVIGFTSKLFAKIDNVDLQDQSRFSNTTQKMIFCLILLSLVSGYVTKRFGRAVNKTKVIRLNDIHE